MRHRDEVLSKLKIPAENPLDGTPTKVCSSGPRVYPIDTVITKRVECAGSKTGTHLVKVVTRTDDTIAHVSCECGEGEGEAISRLGGETCYRVKQDIWMMHTRISSAPRGRLGNVLGNLPLIDPIMQKARMERRKADLISSAVVPMRKRLIEKWGSIAAQMPVGFKDEKVFSSIVINGRPVLSQGSAVSEHHWFPIEDGIKLLTQDSTRSTDDFGGNPKQFCPFCHCDAQANHMASGRHQDNVRRTVANIQSVLNARFDPALARRALRSASARQNALAAKYVKAREWDDSRVSHRIP